ncbi:MAG: AmmeMemoRadiSam system protein A [Candidatus Buchananbacteria bacterium]|nr:AmmeMemoRadiSam system protein A [Candidatus Buchananbacteria bacterium]
MNAYIKLAKQTIKQYLQTGKIIDVPEDTPKELVEKRAGVFICFKNKGQLRGCIGTFLPTRLNLAQEIIQNTVSAATEDNRFLPIKADELDELKITIDILSEPEKIEDEDINQLDPKKFGVLVKSENGFKTGLLLPDLKDVNIVADQISIACQKAGIDPYKDNFLVYKFTVERHEEK